MVHIQKIEFLSFRRWLFGKKLLYWRIYITNCYQGKSLEIRLLKSSLNNGLLKCVFHNTSHCVLLASETWSHWPWAIREMDEVWLPVRQHQDRKPLNSCCSRGTIIPSLYCRTYIISQNVCSFEGINSHFLWKFGFAAFSTKKKKILDQQWTFLHFFHCQLSFSEISNTTCSGSWKSSYLWCYYCFAP